MMLMIQLCQSDELMDLYEIKDNDKNLSRDNNLTFLKKLNENLKNSIFLNSNIIKANSDNLNILISGIRLSYSFNPRMFLQSLIQYNNITNLISVNTRFGLLQSANTGLFVVFNLLKDEDLIDNINNQRLSIKYSYTFDFIK